VASASSIVLAGARPVFADLDPDTQNITAQTIRAVLTQKTKAIICVHLAGLPCDMDPIMDLAREYGLFVIEDCAQAHGARYKGRSVGSIGHVGAWSFCQDKIMTTGGEGGMVTTNDQNLWSCMWSYKDHGKSWNAVSERQHPPGFSWLHESFGTNWRLTEMQAAIGRLQLKKMSEWSRKRQENATALSEFFIEVKALRVLKIPAEITHAYYKYYVFVRPESLKEGWGRDRIMNAICAEGVPCFTGSCSEIYLEKAFVRAGIGPKERLPVAKELGETSLMFLVHPTLSDDAVKATWRAVEKIMRQASE
jgi:dTDP-4-amino-4,6-dideoxygalactose transaminase